MGALSGYCVGIVTPCDSKKTNFLHPVRHSSCFHRNRYQNMLKCRYTDQGLRPPRSQGDAEQHSELVPANSDSRSHERFMDPYLRAGKRLDLLISGLGDGEDELLDSTLMEQSTETKLGLAVLAGSLVAGAAVLCCVLLDLDPAGGARLSIDSLIAAGIGLCAAVPLCLFKNALWSETAFQELPFLEDLQNKQVDEFRPILTNLSKPQAALVLACEVLPTVLIVLPAFTGGVSNMLDMYRQSFDGIRETVPETIPPLVALTLTSLLSGISKLIDQGPTEEEYDVIKDALDNADRYYRVMTGPGEDTMDAEDAFRKVALLWLARRQVAARFAAAISSFEVFYLGLLWFETGDLMAPLVAAFALNAVDFANITNRIPNESSQ